MDGHEEHRGHGLGRQLIAHAEQWFRARSCQDMATDAKLDNIDARDFYRQLGLRETWRIVEFKKSLGTV